MLSNRILDNLKPENLLIDDRKIDDLIMFIANLSKSVNFYNTKNELDGNWSSFFSDETFLLAEISKFDANKFDIQRLNLIKNFDEFSSENDKENILKEFFYLIHIYFKNIDSWYKKALKNNLSIKSSSIEYELEQVIINKLNKSFELFSSFSNSLMESIGHEVSFKEFNSIWKYDKNLKRDIFEEIDKTQSKYSSALKKLILLYKPVYQVLLSLKIKAKLLFSDSLNKNDNHNPQIGLLFSFLELFKNHQNEINNFSSRHLDFYFKEILNQSPIASEPNKVYIDVDIDSNIESLTVSKGKELIAGQDDNGDDIIYKTDHEIVLNNSSLSEISTIYVSRNKIFDYESSFRIISGIFSNRIANSVSEVDAFNFNNDTFSSLGEEQIFKSSQDKTMEVADLGFAISSPTLLSSDSNRVIKFSLYFTADSIQYLSNLIIDISSNTGNSEEEVFSNIFLNAFSISYTSDENWISGIDYKVDYPEDWSDGIILIKIELGKNDPSVSRYDEGVHQKNINTTFPVFQFLLNNDNFYYPYSFLNGMEITRVYSDIEADELKKVILIGEDGEVSPASEFQMFGSIPQKGSKLYIGNEELFCKKIENFSLSWKFSNLPETKNMKEFYKNYQKSIDNKSFKIKLSALSDFVYERNLENEFVFNLFESENNILLSTRKIEIKDSGLLKIKPVYDLTSEMIEEYSNDLETGFLRIELVNPKIGFGFNEYPKILQESIEKTADKKEKDIDPITPNEPFCPEIFDLSLSYKSTSSIIFNESGNLGKDQFYLIHPVEGYRNIESNSKENSLLVPEINSQGELLLGFSDVKILQDLNLFFEIKKNSNTNYKFSSELDWFYSSNNGWKLIDNNSILYDETYNLTKSGVICFRLNRDVSNNSVNSNNGLFYIKASSKTKVDQFSLIKKIILNSVLCTQEINENNLNKILPPNSIQNFKENLDGIITINQILPSFGGNKKESNFLFYKRVSELLGHKNRPSIKKDIENFILQKFNWLGQVKCYSMGKDLKIKILCIKKITTDQTIDEIKLSQADITQINRYLKEFVSPFTYFEIVNPIFEEVWVKAKVKFLNIPSGEGILNLNKDLLDFFCPWIQSKQYESINIGGSSKRSEIINFIKERKYVKFLTGVSILHIKKNKDGNTQIYDSANDPKNHNYIKSGTPLSIIIPRDYNQIEVLENEQYYPPEKTNYSDLSIEENFVFISDKEEQKQIKNNKNTKIKKTPLTFNFKFN